MLLQTFTTPTTGNWLFTVAGAQGGGNPDAAGGLGATVKAPFSCNQEPLSPSLWQGKASPTLIPTLGLKTAQAAGASAPSILPVLQRQQLWQVSLSSSDLVYKQGYRPTHRQHNGFRQMRRYTHGCSAYHQSSLLSSVRPGVHCRRRRRR